MWFTCRFYDAKQALDWGLVNDVVHIDSLEKTTVKLCNEILEKSPMAIRILKAALNADCDGQSGLQQLAGDATMLFYNLGQMMELEIDIPIWYMFLSFPVGFVILGLFSLELVLTTFQEILRDRLN